MHLSSLSAVSAIAGALAVGTVVAVAAWMARWRRCAAARAIARRAIAGERDAERLLARAGYTVCGRQVHVAWAPQLDGESVSTPLRVDLIARRANATFIAEVKTGRVAPLLTNSATRRQLLEYQVATGADGILLVDADRQSVHEVIFPTPETRWGRGGRQRGFLAGVVVGATVVIGFAVAGLLLAVAAG